MNNSSEKSLELTYGCLEFRPSMKIIVYERLEKLVMIVDSQLQSKPDEGRKLLFQHIFLETILSDKHLYAGLKAHTLSIDFLLREMIVLQIN